MKNGYSTHLPHEYDYQRIGIAVKAKLVLLVSIVLFCINILWGFRLEFLLVFDKVVDFNIEYIILGQ